MQSTSNSFSSTLMQATSFFSAYAANPGPLGGPRQTSTNFVETQSRLTTQVALSKYAGSNNVNTQRSLSQFSFSSVSSRSGSEARNAHSAYTETRNKSSLRPMQNAATEDRFIQRSSLNSFGNCQKTDIRMAQSIQQTSVHMGDSSKRCANNNNWSNTAVQNGKSTIDLGNYKLDLNKSDSSMLLTDKKTGETTKVWGDPHFDSNGSSNMFKGPMSLNLADGTKITVGTQGDGAVTYADKLTITKGNDAFVVNGLSQKDGAPLSVQRQRNGRQLDAQTPDGYELFANANGKGWIDPATGRAPTKADLNAH